MSKKIMALVAATMLAGLSFGYGASTSQTKACCGHCDKGKQTKACCGHCGMKK